MASPALKARITSLEERAKRGMDFGLDRVLEALGQIGDPHLAVPAIHVAGTNGKGSVSAMVESIARAGGLRTGLYTSPHLCRIAERIRIDGEPLADDELARVLGVVETRCHDRLTFFEMMTVAAFVAFAEAKVDVMVLEVGLGGRLDATNVVKTPIATAVTSIAFDHTQFLGNTLASIAKEKAGIFKAGSPVVLGPLEGEADMAIVEVAAAVGALPIWRVGSDIVTRAGGGEGAEVVITLRGSSEEVRAKLGLRGAHQIDNAGVAAGLASILAARFPAVGDAIGRGLAEASWPGRFERLAVGGVHVILDGAHNAHGAAALAEALRGEGLEPEHTALVFGALADKDFASILGPLAPLASRRYYAQPGGRAPAPHAALAAIAPGAHVANPVQAVRRAIVESQPGDTVVVAGSLYLVGTVRGALLGIECDPVIAL